MLPYIVEYLLSIRRVNGGNLVHQAASQTVVNQFPPNSQIVLDVFPFAGDYFDIVFHSYFDPTIVPDAFTVYGQSYGSRVYEGILTNGFMQDKIDTLFFISAAEPAHLLVRNNTDIFQYYCGFISFISITSDEDFGAVLQHLKGVGTSETNRILATLEAHAPTTVKVAG